MSSGIPCIVSIHIGCYKIWQMVSSLFVYFVALRYHRRYFSHNETVQEGTGGMKIWSAVLIKFFNVPSPSLILNHFIRSFRETHFSFKNCFAVDSNLKYLRWIVEIKRHKPLRHNGMTRNPNLEGILPYTSKSLTLSFSYTVICHHG